MDKYKKPCIILLSACDKAASALPEGDSVRESLIEAMNQAEDTWIETDAAMSEQYKNQRILRFPSE